MPLRVGDILLLMLLHPHVAATPLLRAQLADSVLSVLQPLSAAIADEVSAARGWHLKGFRSPFLHQLTKIRHGNTTCAGDFPNSICR